MKAQPFAIHARAVDPDVIEEAYNVKIDPNVQINGNQLEQKFFAALGMKNNPNDNNLVFMKEIWVKPCRKYPTGAMLVIAGDKVIYAYSGRTEEETVEEVNPEYVLEPKTYSESDYPYEHGMYPFQKIDHIPSGRFYGSSTLDDIIPLQKEYNKTRSQIVESKNRTAKPQITYEKGSIDPSKMTSEAGLMIPVNPGFGRPEPLNYPQIASYVIQELDRVQADMDDLSSQTGVSKGRTPPGVEAASAIAYLQEENDSALYHTVASIEDATEQIGKQSLALVQQFWDEKHVIEVVSKNSAQDASIFKMANLKGNTDIRVEAGSMAPKSRAAKQAFIVELMQMGAMPPEKGLRYLELNETSRLYEEMQIDTRQAERENIKMATEDYPITESLDEMGVTVPQGGFPVNEFDNDVAHMETHGIFMKSETYELLDEEKQKVILMHYMMHKGKMQAEMMAMQPQTPVPNDNQGELVQ
jgi:hypothetical protein